MKAVSQKSLIFKEACYYLEMNTQYTLACQDHDFYKLPTFLGKGVCIKAKREYVNDASPLNRPLYFIMFEYFRTVCTNKRLRKRIILEPESVYIARKNAAVSFDISKTSDFYTYSDPLKHHNFRNLDALI